MKNQNNKMYFWPIFLAIVFLTQFFPLLFGDQTIKNDSFQGIADYIHKQGKLPGFFIRKKEAQSLGWNPGKGNLCKVAPGKNIGGDVFQNREGKLPRKKGRTYFEADANYKCGKRGADRIIYSNDGWVYKTSDHYNSFQELYKGR